MNRSKPRAVKIIPQVFFSAKENGLPQSPFRLYFLAKTFDNGNGNIPKIGFRNFTMDLGISYSAFYRDLHDAVNLGMITEISSKDGQKLLHLEGYGTAVKIAGVTQWLECMVDIPIDDLCSSGWIALVWAAYLKNYEHKLVSREVLEKKTGVPRRTQISREKKAGVINIENYANYGTPDKNPELAFRLYGEPGVYNRHGFVRSRLPNKRIVPKNIRLANKSRLRKIRRASGIVAGSKVNFDKLFCENAAEFRKAQRMERKNNVPAKNRSDIVFVKTAEVCQRGVYEAIIKK